ncbi:ABC transporter permease [Opitutus terrae]|nr:ABC transporter permease [Opitutus terrae]
MTTLLAEIHEALRQLRRAPGFSLVAVGLLALGLGTTTAICSLAYAIVLRPLPFRDPQGLVGFRAINSVKAITQDGHSASDFLDYAQRAQSFSGLMAYRPNFAAYTRPGEPAVRLVTALVTENFFPVLGVAPVGGRTFSADEFSVSAPRAVVLSNVAWRRLFGAQPNAVGRTILLDDQPHTIVGIMPESFREPEFVDAWLPFPKEAPEYFARDSRFWNIVGRLKPGVTAPTAHAELQGIAADLARQFPETNRDWSTRVQPLHELRTRGMRTTLLLLTGAVALVLAIACLNLANLLLARGLSRLQDLAVRLALGATPQQLARRILIESSLLALLGGAVGCALAAGALPVLVTRLPAGLIPRSQEVALHPPVLLAALAIALITGVLFGLLPALQVLRTDVNTLLKHGGTRGASNAAAARVQGLLVTGQVALSFVVLAASLLLMKSLLQLQNSNPGFDPTHVLTLQLAPPPTRFETNLELAQYYERLVTEAAAVPGVASAAVNASAPLCGITLQYPFWIEGRPRSDVGADEAVYAPVTEDFFATIKLPLKQGRTFNPHDNERGAPVAIINETLARRIFPGENPIGRRVLLLPWLSDQYREIVGVVGDTRQDNLSSPTPAQIYVPQRQMPWFFSTLLVRLNRPDAARAVQAAMQRVDPTLPFSPTTLEGNIALTTTQPRLYATLFGIFAVVALGLSAFGIYASMSFTTRRRTREIGIRMALGSTPSQVLQHVLAQAGRLAAVGLAIGLMLAAIVANSLRGLLYGVQPGDPWIYAALCVFLPLVALAAAMPSALRAARLPPTCALQDD